MNKNILKRVIPALILVLGVAFSACQSGLSNEQPEEGVIEVWASWGDDPEQLQQIFNRYSQVSGVPVAVTTGVKSKEMQKSLSGSAPPDLVILNSNDLVSSYHENGLLEPLDQWIEATGIDLQDFYPAPLEGCKSPDGAYLCLPWGCDVDVLYWNKDLFEAVGLDPERPPQTMEELVEYAGKLTLHNQDGELSQVGFIPDFPRSHTDLYVRMFGGSLYSEGGHELTVNSQPVIEALNWQQQFYDMYSPGELKDFVASFTPYMSSSHPVYAGRRMSCQGCHRSSPLQNKKIPDSGFFESRIAMMIDGEWQVNRSDLSPELPQVNYGVVPFPPPSAHLERASTSVIQGPVAMVPAGAIDKDAALQLLAWMMSPQVLADAAYAYNSLPTTRTAAADSRFHQSPEFEVFLDLIAHPNAGHRVSTPDSTDFNEMLGEIEQTLLYEGGDPAQLLNKVQTELNGQSNVALGE
jgi:multiple sugar transport system substrate-binding protein